MAIQFVGGSAARGQFNFSNPSLAVDVAPISGEMMEDLNTTIQPAVLVGSWFLFD